LNFKHFAFGLQKQFFNSVNTQIRYISIFTLTS